MGGNGGADGHCVRLFFSFAAMIVTEESRARWDIRIASGAARELA
jgi:hypothetical protein